VDGRLALTQEQRGQTKQIVDLLRKQHWELRGKQMEEENKFRDLLEERTPDPKEVGATYAAHARLQQQMIETKLQAHKDIYALLTPEQRNVAEQQRRFVRNLEREGHGYRRGITPR
jgi:Spy/CpxP family protein refolding chaperone